jgi:phosphoserine phosphatase RsbU/P
MIKSFRSRTLLLTITFIIVTSCLLMFLSFLEVNRMTITELRTQIDNSILHLEHILENTETNQLFFNSTTKNLSENHIKSIVDEAITFITTLEETQIPTDTAQKIALETLSKIRFGEEGYIFVFTENYTILSNPNSSLIGKNLKEFQDIKGNKVLQELKKSAENTTPSFTKYWWPLITENKQVEKIGYARTFKKWGWVIGSGLYNKDIEKELALQEKEGLKILTKNFKNLHILGSGSFALFDEKGKIIFIQPSLKKAYSSELIQKLIAYGKQNTQPIHYTLSVDNITQNVESYVRYYSPLKWTLLSIVEEKVLYKQINNLLKNQLLILIILIIVSSLIVYFTVRKLTKPIQELTEWTTHLAETKFAVEGLNTKKLSPLLKNQTREVEHLAKAFTFLSTTLKRYLTHLVKTTKTQEAYESQLRIAATIQRSMLPQKFPPYPKQQKIDLCAFLQPAKKVSGDFFDFFLIQDRYLCLCIGDVTDKGVPAALFMVRSKTLIQNTTKLIHSLNPKTPPSPGYVLSKVNNELTVDNDLMMFVTIFFGVFDIHTGILSYANAGHNPPYIIDTTTVTPLEVKPETALGIKENLTFTDLSIKLKPNSTLFLYTDGLTDANNKDKEYFGEERIEESLSPLPVAQAHLSILEATMALKDFVKETPPFDDVTLLSFSYVPEKTHLLIKIQATKDQIAHLNSSIEEFGISHSLSQTTTSKLKNISKEIITEIINHSFTENKGEIIHLLDIQKPYFIMEFIDNAPEPFDPLKEKKMNNLIENIHYERKSGYNILKFKITMS